MAVILSRIHTIITNVELRAKVYYVNHVDLVSVKCQTMRKWRERMTDRRRDSGCDWQVHIGRSSCSCTLRRCWCTADDTSQQRTHTRPRLHTHRERHTRRAPAHHVLTRHETCYYGRPVYVADLLFLPHTVDCERFCFWRSQSVVFYLYEISREPLNGCAPNSRGRRVWSSLCRVWMSRSKVKG